MTCLFCKHGKSAPGTTTVTLERGATTVIIKQVPAEICGNCGEPFVAAEISRRLLELSEAAVARGAEVEIRRFAT